MKKISKNYWQPEEELKKQLAGLPFSPGVYFFRDEKGVILYIGKAGSLKDRVSSYFREENPLSRPIEWVLEKVRRISFQKTDSVLEAYFLEQELIKKHLPFYNVLGKDDKSFCYLVFTKEVFPRILLFRKTDLEKLSSKNKIKKGQRTFLIDRVLGPYSSRKTLEEALRILRKIFPFHSEIQDDEKKCFDFQIGLCPGPYTEKITQKEYGRNILAIRSVLLGKKESLLKRMEKEMLFLSNKQQFEKAAILRNRIFSLKKIKDTSLMKEEEVFLNNNQEQLRIEGYDVSSLSGGLFVGSMVVFVKSGGFFAPEKGQYRKFKIKNRKIDNDLAAMKEVLFRRFKRMDWPKPDLVILDGGESHLSLVEGLLAEFGLKIPLLSIAKGPDRKKADLRQRGVAPKLTEKEIIQIRDEAHRFAVAYHRKIRKRAFLTGRKKASIIKKVDY